MQVVGVAADRLDVGALGGIDWTWMLSPCTCSTPPSE
jgi:hypothetical protein